MTAGPLIAWSTGGAAVFVAACLLVIWLRSKP